MRMILDVLSETGITATAGIGTQSVSVQGRHGHRGKARSRRMRTACALRSWTSCLTARYLWDHTAPDGFLAGGPRLCPKAGSPSGCIPWATWPAVRWAALGNITTRTCLYKLFGVNAELLIDHAWGWEPCTIDEIKAYRPRDTAVMGSGQVLHCPYPFEKARLVATGNGGSCWPSTLVEKGLVTDQLVLTVGYDVDNLTDPADSQKCIVGR